MGFRLITGGARSGKSTYAEHLAKEQAELKGSNVLYIAIAIPYDEEMKERIRLHKEQRPSKWRTVEKYRDLDQLFISSKEQVILLDCVTVLVTNLLFEYGLNENQPGPNEVKKVEEEISLEIDKLLAAPQLNQDCEVILVTNELGMGLVPPYPLGRIFRDLAGRVNQRIAAACDQVVLMVSGIPVVIKDKGAR